MTPMLKINLTITKIHFGFSMKKSHPLCFHDLRLPELLKPLCELWVGSLPKE
jgi:hypothetical protein